MNNKCDTRRGITSIMTKCDVMNKEIADVRKECDAFNKDITMMLRKPLGKRFFFNQEANISGPENTGPEATEEDTGEEIVYRPPLQGRWKERNEKTTLEAYEFTPRD
uniref:Uncharacterized protein n=1 Tax=Solanum tuberosum TaxID=4113 RepID=M1DTF6_SOLTU